MAIKQVQRTFKFKEEILPDPIVTWSDKEVKQFYAECYLLIHDRIQKTTLMDRQGRNMAGLNSFLSNIQAKPTLRWKNKYGL